MAKVQSMGGYYWHRVGHLAAAVSRTSTMGPEISGHRADAVRQKGGRWLLAAFTSRNRGVNLDLDVLSGVRGRVTSWGGMQAVSKKGSSIA
jgi:hypothetical protein